MKLMVYLKIADIFGGFIETSYEEDRNNPICLVASPTFTVVAGLKYPKKHLKNLLDTVLILIIEVSIRSGESGTLGLR